MRGDFDTKSPFGHASLPVFICMEASCRGKKLCKTVGRHDPLETLEIVSNLGALIITYTILAVPYCSIMAPTLISFNDGGLCLSVYFYDSGEPRPHTRCSESETLGPALSLESSHVDIGIYNILIYIKIYAPPYIYVS